jgi:hypothetical protein
LAEIGAFLNLLVFKMVFRGLTDLKQLFRSGWRVEVTHLLIKIKDVIDVGLTKVLSVIVAIVRFQCDLFSFR